MPPVPFALELITFCNSGLMYETKSFFINIIGIFQQHIPYQQTEKHPFLAEKHFKNLHLREIFSLLRCVVK